MSLNPKAKWQDGTPATAEDLNANFEALRGKYKPDFKGTPRSGRIQQVVESVELVEPYKVFIKTKSADPPTPREVTIPLRSPSA